MKLRVLEVLATLKRAGAERTAVTLAAGLDRGRFDCEVVSLFDAFPDGFEPELETAGVAVRHLGKRPGFDARMYPRLARAMREFQPAVVHTHSYVMRYTWPVCNSAIVHTVHNLAQREVDRVGRMVHRLALRRGGHFVAIGKEVARSFREVYGTDTAAVIPNGAVLAAPRVDREAWRHANGFGAGDVLVVSVARLDPQKNPLMLVEALPDDPGCHLLMAGDGGLSAELSGRATGRIHLLGVRRDIPDLLGACDVFALSSDYEGLPVAVIEAMSAGLPVVATSVGGVPELVEHGVTGLLVPRGDRVAFSRALARLLMDGDLRRAMGRVGKERAKELGADRMIASYAALFERIAGAR